MKKQFIMTRGISFSGKSSFAKEKAKELGNAIIITKDDIRLAMGGRPNGKRVKESRVIEERNKQIIEALEKGKHIISADTNFQWHEKNLRALVFPKYREQYDFVVQDFTNIPFETILERVEKTDRPEGKDFWKQVVHRQKNDWLPTPYLEQDESLEKIVLSDCDGCINIVHPDRSPYIGTDCHMDEPNEIVVDYLRMMKERGFRIVLMSGLGSEYRKQREGWLENNNVPYDELYMRAVGDSRKDCQIKDELFDAHIKGKYFVYVVIEDRMQMREYYTNKGLSHRMLSIGNCFKEF